MKRKTLNILIFIIGLIIFSYPIISNKLSTTAHKKMITNYQYIINNLSTTEKSKILKKSFDHNQKLKNEPNEFIDPFKNGSKDSGNKSYYDALNLGKIMGIIIIDKINVELPIYHGTSAKILSKGAGHLENTSLPLGNNGDYSVITAHRGLPSAKLFRNIDELNINDEFKIQVLDEIMTYKIFDIEIVLPDETSWLQSKENKSIVTLLSCEPYMINTHRLLVKGELTGRNKISKKITSKNITSKTNNYMTLIIVSLLILLVFIVIFLKKR